MARHGKKHRETAGKRDSDLYDLPGAIDFIRQNPGAGFDESLEMAFRLGVDFKKSDQAVRGSVTLPHGSGKNVRILVFATGQAAEVARETGADYVGFEDMIAKIQSGWLDFDIAVSTTEAMKEVRKLGKVLGPRGLMPNPKTGTVTDDVEPAVKQFKAGRVEFRMDRHGNVHVPFGKRSFNTEQLAENGVAVVQALMAAKPAAAKGVYIRRCVVSSTMGPGLPINLKELAS